MLVQEKQEMLSKHQEVLLQLLEIFDGICRKHGIPYQLFAGTALGAVRHQGMIPWDDDLDIVMLRPDYERFLKAAEAELRDQNRVYLQKEFSQHWPMFFSKLRMNNTACMERLIPKDPQMHQGIYIDIFPCDNLSNRNWIRKLQFALSKIVIAKSLDQRGYLTDSTKKKVFMRLCRCLPKKLLWSIAVQRNDKESKWVHTFFGASSKYEKSIYPREWFTESVELSFEDKAYPLSKYYDALLTKLYDDYMTPLPEDQRACKVHADIVDAERSYECYLEQQRQMKITQYTRSIR